MCIDVMLVESDAEVMMMSPREDSTSPEASDEGKERVFACTMCSYRTERKNNLKRHTLTMHEVCPALLECCGLRFLNKAELRMHTHRYHRDGYHCDVCNRVFCRKALLKRHYSVHTGYKEFSCRACSYQTSHKSNLERHLRVHQKPAPPLPPHLLEQASYLPELSQATSRFSSAVNLHQNLLPSHPISWFSDYQARTHFYQAAGGRSSWSMMPVLSPAVLQQQSSPLQQHSSLFQQQSSPLQQQSSPLQQQSLPLQQQSSPLQQQSLPLQQQSSPLQQQASPLQQQSSPLQQQQPAAHLYSGARQHPGASGKKTGAASSFSMSAILAEEPHQARHLDIPEALASTSLQPPLHLPPPPGFTWWSTDRGEGAWPAALTPSSPTASGTSTHTYMSIGVVKPTAVHANTADHVNAALQPAESPNLALDLSRASISSQVCYMSEAEEAAPAVCWPPAAGTEDLANLGHERHPSLGQPPATPAREHQDSSASSGYGSPGVNESPVIPGQSHSTEEEEGELECALDLKVQLQPQPLLLEEVEADQEYVPKKLRLSKKFKDVHKTGELMDG